MYNFQSTTSSPTNEIKNTTVAIEPILPVNRTLPGKIEEKPDKVADVKSVCHFSRLVVYKNH